jgi:predicted nucleic acid-binding protein
VSFLLDTNIVSELRRGTRTEPGLLAWFDEQPARSLFMSVLTVGEIRQGIEQLRRKDPGQAGLLDRWLYGLTQYYEDRMLYVDGAIVEEWGRLRARRALPVVDALLAATARVHDLTLVTRNVRDFRATAVRVLNPMA